MKYAVCLLPVIPMRKEPAHRSEMVSQLLFGEYVSVLDQEGDFLNVECTYDGYMGWVQGSQLEMVEDVMETNMFTQEFYSEVLLDGEAIKVPFGTPVHGSPGSIVTIGGHDVSYPVLGAGHWNNKETVMGEGSLQKAYLNFLNTPYLWGGKSVFGIDCSGFVQQVFKLCGVKLLRDAYLQATQGEETDFDNAMAGDLAFFQNEKRKITHVGLILSGNRIVHASGKVRIDTLYKDGIVNMRTEKRTHHLHSIRRF